MKTINPETKTGKLFTVYANNRKAGNGVEVTEYVMGQPSRKLIAAGYKALALGLA